jgi:hypothetical protein
MTQSCGQGIALGHRKNNVLRTQDELLHGYYLSAEVMMAAENGPAVLSPLGRNRRGGRRSSLLARWEGFAVRVTAEA